jgi:hypothetical protein
MPDSGPLTARTGAKPHAEQRVILLMSSLCVDLDLNIQQSLTVVALPLPRPGLSWITFQPAAYT